MGYDTLNNGKKPNKPSRGHIYTDFPPANSKCEWCGEVPDHLYGAQCGEHHNESVILCHSCGEVYTDLVEQNSQDDRAIIVQILIVACAVVNGSKHARFLSGYQNLEDDVEKIETWEEYLLWLNGRYPQ